jgi:hypothetical protein
MGALKNFADDDFWMMKYSCPSIFEDVTVLWICEYQNRYFRPKLSQK